MPTRQPLSDARWTVRAVGDLSQVPANIRGRTIPATVPGCIHTDLMDADLIPDPAVGMNEKEVQWVSWTDWRYECEFDAGPALFPHHEIDLCFECLDTIATIELNGIEIGKAASEFIPWCFGMQGILRPGRNTLAVTFTSPLRHVHEMAARLGPRPHNGDEQGWAPFNMIRKCASNFGWDWGPRVATCGITGGIHLSSAQLVTLVPSPLPASPRPRVEFCADPFQFTIDGQPTFIKGANWIPEGLWLRDRTPQRVRQRLQQLLDANMNMIRVWGGGRYEPDWFYDLCDEMGIMVWQDFMFACACYPEEEPLRSLIEREARYQVARLSRHPSVVLWCGGNECHWAYESWGFRERLAASSSPKTWGQHYWQEMFPNIVAELSPGTPYWPDSPWSGDASRPPNSPDAGDRHTWDAWGDGYRTIVPRFCSEFGQQAPSNWRTLEEAGLVQSRLRKEADEEHVALVEPSTPEQPPSGGGSEGGSRDALRSSDLFLPPALLSRQLGPDGNARWYDQPMREWFREPRDLDEWHAMAQLLQARSLRIGIEWMRANRPRCLGALVWQLNDAWPGLSWSLIDSAGRPKLSLHAVRSAFSPVLLTIQPIDSRLRLCLVCDEMGPVSTTATVRRMRLDGTMLNEVRGVQLFAHVQGVCRDVDLESLVGSPDEPCEEFLIADLEGHRATWFYEPDRSLQYRIPALKIRPISSGGHPLILQLTAQTVIRDLWLDPDRLPPGFHAELTPSLRTLLPGEHVYCRVGSDHSTKGLAPPLDWQAALRPPVLWSANALHASPAGF